MDIEKFFIKPDNTAVIKCPHCQISKTVPLEKINDPKKMFKVKCLCKKSFNVVLESRKMFRKETELKGRYFNQSRANDEGSIVVNNISMNGVGLYTLGAHKIAPDNILKIEYRLDDRLKTFLSREVVVRAVNGKYIGAEYVNIGAYDKYLDFYLIP